MSREVALRRFLQLEKLLKLNPVIREQYVEKIRDFQRLGHLQLADRRPFSPHYYIPHHCVLKKFRVVFDGSSRTTNGFSINEMQLIGERLQEDLLDLIIRFRWNKVAITADIKQM